MTAEIANADMRAAWDGEEGERWTKWAEAYEASGVRHKARIFEAAAIAPNQAVLDIGCGTGDTTMEAARRASPGQVLGVDLSSKMLERARDLAQREGLDNVAFEQGDAQVHPFEPESFDVAISRSGVMFFEDPVAAFANIRRALRPGGRLAVMAWREFRENTWILNLFTALKAGRDIPDPPMNHPGPFGLAGRDFARSVFTDAGFGDVGLQAVDEPVYLGADVESAFDWAANGVGITKGMLEHVDEAGRAEALEKLRAAVNAADTGDGVWMDSAAWLITGHR